MDPNLYLPGMYESMIPEILQEHPYILPAIRKSCIKDQEAIEIIRKYPFIFPDMKDPSFDMCKVAVEEKPSNILHVPVKYRKQLRLIACKKNPELIPQLSNPPWTTKEIKELIEYRPSSVRYFSYLPKTYIDYAISLDPNIELYYPDRF